MQGMQDLTKNHNLYNNTIQYIYKVLNTPQNRALIDRRFVFATVSHFHTVGCCQIFNLLVQLRRLTPFWAQPTLVSILFQIKSTVIYLSFFSKGIYLVASSHEVMSLLPYQKKNPNSLLHIINSILVSSLFLNTCSFAVVLEHFTQNQLVGVFAEWIAEHGSRNQVHVAVGALSLIGAGAIEVPLGQIYGRRKNGQMRLLHINTWDAASGERIWSGSSWGRVPTLNAFRLTIQCPGLAPEPLSCSINPNVHGLDFIPLREVHVLLFHSFTQAGTGRCGHLCFPTITHLKIREGGEREKKDEQRCQSGWLRMTCCVTIGW